MSVVYSITVLIATLACLTSCQISSTPSKTETPNSLPFKKSALNGTSLKAERYPNYLAIKLPFAAVEELRLELESKLGRTLQHRGEAHITVVTPPEFEKLSPYVTIEEIHQIADLQKMQKAVVTPICLGRGQMDLKETYFIVVRSQPLLAIRQALRDLVIRRGGGREIFKAEHFFPHVTVGFTERDLHESDGVVKGANACVYKLED